uniref:Leucine-rich repeat protein SHOC-2 n=1 Tax=Branchiostoma floridae TaxID=7739 RepID=C3Y8Z5_BRAFL|eukprot:XP_002607041.1 hypothetical protein BRAFLDRAFT_93565 [Branchiostoma floridae]
MDRTKKGMGKQHRTKVLKQKTDHAEEDNWAEKNLKALMKKTSSSKELDLSDHHFEQIPPEVFGIKDIEFLDVSNNPLGSIPVNIASLSNLKELRAAGCGITEVSGNISRCTYLNKVDLSRNPGISSLPVTMKENRYLKILALSGCELKSLPKNLTLLTMIETLDLSNNELTTLPSDISALQRLKVLILSDNALEGIPESVESLGHLHFLEMKRNKMNNSRGFQKLSVPPHLKTLDMEGNHSLKMLPEGLENLESLEELNISYCGIETLPDSIGNVTSIKRLHLAGNKLRKLPENFGNLLNLETLDLEGNRRLSGLPRSLYHLRENLRGKQRGTNIGLILDNCPALALTESEIAQGNVVSVLAELLSEETITKSTTIVTAEVVEDTIMEGLTENMVAVTEECVWNDLMTDAANVAISDKELSENTFQSMLEEVLPDLVKGIATECVQEERAMIIMTGELLEETTRSMTEEVATEAVLVDAVTREVVDEILEEVRHAATEELARNTVSADEVSWGMMGTMLKEAKAALVNEVATDAVLVDDVAREVMDDFLEEVSQAMAEELARTSVHVDEVSWETMENMLEEAKTALAYEVATDAVTQKAMDELLEEVSKAMAEEIAQTTVTVDELSWEMMEEILEEAKTPFLNKVATDAVLVHDATRKVMDELLEEVSHPMAEELARTAVEVDEVSWDLMEELLEEAKTALVNEVATTTVLVDEVAWKVLQELLKRQTKKMIKSIALKEEEECRLATEMMDDFVDEISKATAESVAMEVDEELRLGQTVPNEYDTQTSHNISAAAHGVQYVDLPAGGRLSVPPGATDEDISVITAVLNPHGYDMTICLEHDELLVSDILEMRPARMEFSKPVQLKIQHSLPKFYCEKEFIVKTTEDLGYSWRTLKTTRQQEQGRWFVTVNVDHFSEFVVVARPREHLQRVKTGQLSTLSSSQQTDVEMFFPRDCVPSSKNVSFKVLPVDADTLTCAGTGENAIRGIDSMSHIVKFCRGSNLLLSSPATIVLPLSPGDGDGRVRVLSCDERGRWEDVTGYVDDIVLQGSKVAFTTDQLKSGFTVLRCDNLNDPTRIVKMVIKNIRARQVRILIFKKWKEPREEGVMSARIECVLSQRVEDRIVYAEQVEGFERQVGTPTPPIRMMEGEQICVIFEGSIRPVENDCGVDYTFYCERPRVLEFEVKFVDKGKGATSRVELYPGRLEKLFPGTKRRKIRGPTIQKKPPPPPPPRKQTTPPPPKIEKLKPPKPTPSPSPKPPPTPSPPSPPKPSPPAPPKPSPPPPPKPSPPPPPKPSPPAPPKPSPPPPPKPSPPPPPKPSPPPPPRPKPLMTRGA